MPVQKRDPHSGAILFTATKEEREVAELRKEVSELKKMNMEMLELVSQFIKSSEVK